MIQCNLCLQDFSVLPIIDFKNMIWKQGNKFQELNSNKLIKNFELDLCRDCRNKIFKNSKVTINFSQKLIEALILANKPIIHKVITQRLK